MKAYHEAIAEKIPAAIRTMFFKETHAVIATGRTFYSATTIMQYIRFHTDIYVNDPDAHYKINNNWTPVLAREFLAAHPEHSKFFKTREQARVPQEFYAGDFEELSHITPADPKQAPFPPVNCYVAPPAIDNEERAKAPLSNANRLARSFCLDLAT